ncbi:hypothetical protein F4678DRAFT_102638 [Xylaria arbuscula]|nr:hypothetical protein F4678DRAFT_102638 [Xylaria arbuscula]
MSQDSRLQLYAATSVQAQPHIVQQYTETESNRTCDTEKIRTRERKAKKRDALRQVYGSLDSVYAQGMTNIYCARGMTWPPNNVSYCSNGLSYPGTEDTPDGGVDKNDYIPPTAHTVTATSSTKAFIATKLGEPSRSNGPMGIRPGFGFSSVPVLEEITLGAAVTVAWIATWRYL